MSLRHRVWERRMLRRTHGATHHDVERLFAMIEATIDVDRLRRLHAAHRHSPFDLREACDHERKLRIAIVKALLEELHRARPLRILDLGHGGGYFVTVCRRLGHAAQGTEVPTAHLPAGACALYAEITAALGFLDEQRLWIERLQPLELSGAFDLICAHKICFNDHGKPTTWRVPEWEFFVDDLRRFLAPGGRIVLELNENVERFGALRWYGPQLRSYFASIGTVDDHRITITA